MALGKSLGNILGDYFGQDTINLQNIEANFDPNTSVVLLPIDKIQPSPFQTRSIFEDKKIDNLANSIKESGLIHPILVLKKDLEATGQTIKQFEYILLAGERRLRACKSLGYTNILAIVKPFESLSSKQQAMLSAVENLQREDLSPIEMAGTFLMLMQTQNFDEQELANSLGHSLQYIKNYIRLLTLDGIVQQALLERKIGEGQARFLVGLEPELQNKILDFILAHSLTVKEIAELVRKTKDIAGDLYKKLSFVELEKAKLDNLNNPAIQNKSQNDTAGENLDSTALVGNEVVENRKKKMVAVQLSPTIIIKAQKLAEAFPNATLKCTGSDEEGKIVISWKKGE
jgi:ParB family transcriptional regulator, chromosome partitioning protein